MIQVICFSRQRPLQLHGYLSSLFRHWTGDITVSVLVKLDAGYEQAYAEVADEFGQVIWLHETNFASDLMRLLGDAPLTCFGCDDVVYVAPVNVERVAAALSSPDLLGLSLRLGRNITHDMFGWPMPQPAFGRTVVEWDVTTGVGDWGYPWEVLGTVYRTDFVKHVLGAIVPGSPSQLEERGWKLFGGVGRTTRHMLAYPTSRLVVPTVNIVQREFPNGIAGPLRSPEELLEQWHDGWRLDVDAYQGMEPASWRIGDLLMRRALVNA